MNLHTSFEYLLQELAVVMTTPSFQNFVTIVTGWIFARRRTVTGMLVAAGVAGQRHHSAFHRFFAEGAWSLDALGLAVFRLLEPLLAEGQILVAIDDTLARKRGLKVFGVDMHHDPLLSSRGKTVTNWGHSWVVLGVIVEFPLWPGRAFCLPILFRLYLGHKAAKRAGVVHRTRPELAVQMLQVLCRHRKNRIFHAICDSAYGGQSVLCQLPINCELTSRLVMNARLYATHIAKPGAKGRPRKRGQRLATPEEMLDGRAQRVTLNLYGRRDSVRLVQTTACVYAAPQRLLRVVAVEPTRGGRKQQAFYSTCHTATALEVLSWYARRWSIEVAFHDSKTHLGFEEPQGWTRRAAERTAPIAMLLYSLIVKWFATEGHRHYRPLPQPWYAHKQHASFGDMLATLRRRSIHEQTIVWGLHGPGSQKILQTIEHVLNLAA